MGRRIRIELTARNDFWRNAFFVEWNHQYPDRALDNTPAGLHSGLPVALPAALPAALMVAEDWLPDLERVAGQCFSAVRPAPADPGRRRIFSRLFSSGRG